MKGFRISREGKPDLDARDFEVVDTAMNMRGESYFYTVSKILKDFDMDDEVNALVDTAVKMSLDAVWDIARSLAEKHGDEAASLFLSSFMATMTLEIIDHTLTSKLLNEADEILKGDAE